MTREEALEMLKYNSNVIHQTIDGRTDPKEVEALDMAIKALEQEPCDTDGITVRDVTTAFQFGVAMGLAKKYDEMDNVIEEVKKVLKEYEQTELMLLPSTQSEIIYCKDCKFTDGKGPIADGRYWCTLHPGFMDFCSDAERKTDDNGKD